MKIIAALIAVFFLFSTPAVAQTTGMLTIDLAEKGIDITTGFDGATLVVYGNRKQPGDIAVTLRGSDQNLVVRRKDHLMGLWMNGKSLRFDDVPGYYDLALSKPLADLAPFDVLRRYNIGLDALDLDPKGNDDSDVINTFREALIRNQQSKSLFPLEPRSVNFIEDGFFKVSFALPANVPAGIYRVEAFLLQGGEMKDMRSAELKVAQNGVSADIFLFAYNHALSYAAAAVMMALFFGWGAYVVLRRE